MTCGPSSRRIHLLRHAMPLTDPRVEPSRWELSGPGRQAARRIAAEIPVHARLLSSSETKAIQTARLAAAREPAIDGRFDEVRRPGEPFDDRARDRRRAWIMGELDARHTGWESITEAGARFDSAVREHDAGDLVIATHGMVITAWLLTMGRLRGGSEAAGFWARLPFPALISIDPNGG